LIGAAHNLFNMSLIRNSKQVKQSIDFEGFEFGNIHPSDIDCVLEFDNKHLILIEVKRFGNDIPTGQRLMLERIADSWHGNSIVIKVEHGHGDEGDIPLTNCVVTKYYYKNNWADAKGLESLNSVLYKLAITWGIDKLKPLADADFDKI
jgi:hypothetical protein